MRRCGRASEAEPLLRHVATVRCTALEVAAEAAAGNGGVEDAGGDTDMDVADEEANSSQRGPASGAHARLAAHLDSIAVATVGTVAMGLHADPLSLWRIVQSLVLPCRGLVTVALPGCTRAPHVTVMAACYWHISSPGQCGCG